MPFGRLVETEGGPCRILGLDEVEIGEERCRLISDEFAAPDASDDGACSHGVALDTDDLPVLVPDDDREPGAIRSRVLALVAEYNIYLVFLTVIATVARASRMSLPSPGFNYLGGFRVPAASSDCRQRWIRGRARPSIDRDLALEGSEFRVPLVLASPSSARPRQWSAATGVLSRA